MTTDRWDPFRDMMTFREAMDRWLHQSISGTATGHARHSQFNHPPRLAVLQRYSITRTQGPYDFWRGLSTEASESIVNRTDG